MIKGSTRVDVVITSKSELVAFMTSKHLDKFYDPYLVWDLSSQYGIDPGFAMAVFILETGWGESDLYQRTYNPAGIVSHGKYRSYDTRAEGLEDMFRLLRAYADGSIDYVGVCNTVEEVRNAWSEAEDLEKILTLWRLVYD